MKNTATALLCSLSLVSFAHATTYNYVTPTSVSTYTTPPAVANAPSSTTQLLGNLAGNLTASKLANNSGNPAAIMGTQNALMNTESSAISSSVVSAFNSLVK